MYQYVADIVKVTNKANNNNNNNNNIYMYKHKFLCS